MSTLHLIDDRHPAAPAVLASLIDATPDIEHRVFVWRCAPVRRELETMGVPCGSASVRAPRGAPPGVVVAWSTRCARVAAWLWRRPVNWVVFEPPATWCATAMAATGVTALCFTPALAARLDGVTVEPVFAPRLLAPRNGHAWRRRDGDRVVALLADDPRAADAAAGVLTIAIAEEADRDRPDAPRLRLLAHPDAAGIARARRITDDAGAPHRLLVDPEMDRPWRVLTSCDAALLWGSGHGVAAAWTRLAGLPVVTADSGSARDAAARLRTLPRDVRPVTPEPPALPGWRRVLT